MRQSDESKCCLVPVGRLPRLSRSMHFGGDVSGPEANDLLGPRDPKGIVPAQ